ncbi:4-hydroxybenzoate polyprenyl transferase [Calocera viscosa TUFC12733]|uniref:4-hydroxybenzoate polyprenyltransferase, mitochondrial n=1 Tax=Calocera viscosa (strain TUFC12733) TaxID=1330018 RepID=A0A167K627_CALVF|nr:4-hydroxybenzoate polyprenyl transferase [Calocera viscosa TUFC12733]
MSSALFGLSTSYLRSLLVQKHAAGTPTSSTPSTAPSSPARTSIPLPQPKGLKWPLSTLPRTTHPYLFLARLDNPAGTLLLWLPCAWSVAIAARKLDAPPSTALYYTLYFVVGSLISHSMGCTVNDMVDRDLDRLVERTKSRPLASGAISMSQAFAFLLLEVAIWLAWLAQFNRYTVLLGAACIPLVIIYPFMKRHTYWPQAVLGIAFNWGAMAGYSAISAPPAWAVAGPLYAAGWCWTIIYDTIYAHQDKADDLHAGIKSTALLFAHRTVPILAAFSTGMLVCLAYVGWAAGLGLAYYALAVVGSALLLGRTLLVTDWDDRESCWRGFNANVQVGLLVTAGVWADYALDKLLA